MKKIYILLALILIIEIVNAQIIQFEPVFPISPAPETLADFEGTLHCDALFLDVDGDSDQDVVITGSYDSQLYINDGLGKYNINKLPFLHVFESSADFADVDGDSDLDILIGGSDTTILYLNDGLGNFTQKLGTSFIGISNGDLEFADIDNDGDKDVLITGNDMVKLYINDSLGNFTLATGSNFTGVDNSAIAFGDIDGDNDKDVIITGGNWTTRLYRNDGLGNFTSISHPFVGVMNGAVAFADIDGDNDQDVVIAGFGTYNNATIYFNDGLGNFTEDTNNSLLGGWDNSLAFADVDGDNDQDLLITGEWGDFYSKLYINDGLGNFTEQTSSHFDGASYSSVVFGDMDNDNDLDVLIVGKNKIDTWVSRLYRNDGIGNFKEVRGTPIENIREGDMVFGDIDNDGDVDLLISGRVSYNTYSNGDNVTKLYANDGNGNFTEISSVNIENVSDGSSIFLDIDGNGYNDLLLTGENNSSQPVTKLYYNDGTGYFTEINGTIFDEVFRSSVDTADIDGDGDVDILIIGSATSSTISKIYVNDGIGIYSELLGTSFIQAYNGDCGFVDYDNDGDKDVYILNGQDAKIYTNDGLGNFTEFAGTPQWLGEQMKFVDIDGDNDLDIFTVDNNYSFFQINDGNCSYTPFHSSNVETGTPFVYFSSYFSFADFDGDNDQDLLVANDSTKLYINDGTGVFTKQQVTPFRHFDYACVGVADIDGDNDIDLLISGKSGWLRRASSKLYRNTSCFKYNTITDTVCSVYIAPDSVVYTSSGTDVAVILINSSIDFNNTWLFII